MIAIGTVSCAVCEAKWTMSEPSPQTCSHNCPRETHWHGRCDSCSPPGWFAIVPRAGEA